MNAKTLIVGLIATLAAAGSFANDAFNGEASYDAPQPSRSSLTRAEVQAELARALAAGELAYSDADGYKIPVAMSTRSRDEVHAEVASAAANRELAHGEAAYKFPEAISLRSRDEVRAEVLKAAREGTLLRADG
jgi:hypothetical protein